MALRIVGAPAGPVLEAPLLHLNKELAGVRCAAQGVGGRKPAARSRRAAQPNYPMSQVNPIRPRLPKVPRAASAIPSVLQAANTNSPDESLDGHAVVPFTLVRYRIACTRRNDILVCGRKRICTRSCIDIASPQARRRAACQNQSPTAGVQATSGQRVGLLLVGVERDGPPATSEPPTLSLPSPPSCELVAPCGGETRERSAGCVGQ